MRIMSVSPCRFKKNELKKVPFKKEDSKENAGNQGQTHPGPWGQMVYYRAP